MDLYYGRWSGNSARALFGLLEAGASFEHRLVDTKAAKNKEPAYLALNPMGKIPALQDGAFKLWESNAINLYVAEQHPAAGLLPASAQDRASVYRWLLFQTGHVTPACLPVMRATHPGIQAQLQSKGDPQAAEAGRKELARYLPVLEEALAGREWLLERFSLAEIAFTPHLTLVGEGGFDFSAYPNLRGWLQRVQARPAWQETARRIFGA